MFGNRMSLTGTLGFVVATVALFCLGSTARAEDSNRDQARANLQQGGWQVIYGKNFTEGDYVKATAAVASSISTGNPGPVIAFFEDALNANWIKIKSQLKDAAVQEFKKAIVQSIQQKRLVNIKGLQIEAGFVTYQRWNRIVVEVPDGFDFKTGKIKMKKIEKKVSLPNWHQFYIRYKVVVGR